MKDLDFVFLCFPYFSAKESSRPDLLGNLTGVDLDGGAKRAMKIVNELKSQTGFVGKQHENSLQ